jgi:hypothetical protein
MITRLLIITTGGTIDKVYFDDKSDYQVGEPQIKQILNAMNVGFEFEVMQSCARTACTWVMRTACSFATPSCTATYGTS